MEWTQLKVICKVDELDSVSAVVSMVDNSIMIEDYSDIEENLMTVYGELIDEAILNADKTTAAVSIFVPEEKSVSDAVAFIKERLAALKIEAKIQLEGLDEEDWANEWKKYYHPIHIGRSIVVRPPWEKYQAEPGETVIIMDPGMAFGTGTHETTRLCLTALEKYINPKDCVLDVGTGSGILAIAASLMGAELVCSYDIDPVAVRVAKDNYVTNNCNNIECGVSDLLASAKRQQGGYDLVLANIVADIILRMIPQLYAFVHVGTRVVTSGIIAEQSDRVKQAFVQNGYALLDTMTENDWVSFVFQKL